MLDRLREADGRYREIEARLGDPAVTSDIDAYRALMKEYKELTPVITEYRRRVDAEKRREEASLLCRSEDPELRQLAAEEMESADDEIREADKRLTLLLLPKDPDDGHGVVVEIRACAGGEEACLFAADIFRMYSMWCASVGFAVSVISANRTELGGYRKLIFTVDGDGAYSKLKYESGVHEVKRVPVTESNGRIQTSTVSVAVMAQPDDVEVTIDPKDVLLETCKSSGAGGQHINKTESAVRLTHVPTGIVVECQEERSQLQNREKAMRTLRAILYDTQKRERDAKITSERRSLIGTGDRSERIRVYRFQENLVCDERIKYKSPTLGAFLNGDMSALLDALSAYDVAQRLNNGNQTYNG